MLKLQQQKIAAFSKQNVNLDFELIQDRKQKAMLRSPALERALVTCKGEIETYLRKVRMEELLIKETQQSIKALSVRQQAQQRARGGEGITRYNNGLLGKQANILQQRLDVSMVKYNKILGENMKLREQIDGIVHHRDVFDKIFARIGAETSLISDETARLYDQIEETEAERNKIAEEMDKAAEKAAAETMEFERKLAEDHEARKLERRRVTSEKRKMDVTNTPDLPSPAKDPRARLRQAKRMDKEAGSRRGSPNHDAEDDDNDEEEPVQVGQLSHEEEASLLSQSTTAKWKTVTQKTVITDSKQQLWEIKKFFDQLEEVTGIADADELSKMFLESERRIFSVFRDINAVTEDIDGLQQEVAALEAAQATHNPNREQNLLHRRAVLKTKQTLLRADEYQKRYNTTRSELASLEEQVVEMRNAVLASSTSEQVVSMAAQLSGRASPRGESGATTESLAESIMKNLGQLEQHIREVLSGTSRGGRKGAQKRFNADIAEQMRKKLMETEKVVKKKLNHDSIFKEGFNDSDENGDDFEGVGGMLPHSTLKTKRLVRRHFANKGSGGNSRPGTGNRRRNGGSISRAPSRLH